MEMTTDMQVAATSSCDQTVLSQQDPSQSQKDPRNRSIQSQGKKLTELKMFPLILLTGLGLKSEPQTELEASMSSELHLSMDGVREAIHT